MKYQKVIKMLDNPQNQRTKFKTKNCVQINDNAHGT